MELDNNELTTVLCALENAIIYSKLIAEQSNNNIFLKPDFEEMKTRIEKWQRKQSKLPKKSIIDV